MFCSFLEEFARISQSLTPMGCDFLKKNILEEDCLKLSRLPILGSHPQIEVNHDISSSTFQGRMTHEPTLGNESLKDIYPGKHFLSSVVYFRNKKNTIDTRAFIKINLTIISSDFSTLFNSEKT